MKLQNVEIEEYFLNIKTNLITNFKPNLNFNQKTLKFYKKNPTQIYCKIFFIYIILIKYKNFFKKSNIFIKKQIKNTHTILRSPYRHKLARHQLFFNRYLIYSKIKIKLNCIIFKDIKNLFIFIKKLKKVKFFFESNVIYINNIKIVFTFRYVNNFFLKNFITNK